ncbi:MerR family DNA-binding protein, partial [Ralstonia mannitolilytica]|uniref:MerR family DNA-binding protein n=1 Tax=Ralstonia mannitolilytica TaxID=105219 RepID=UPI0029309FEF
WTCTRRCRRLIRRSISLSNQPLRLILAEILRIPADPQIRILLGLRDNPAQDCGDVNTLLDAHIRQTEDRVEALLQLKRHLLSLREKCSGARRIEACGILQGLSDCNHPGCNA